MRTTRKNKDINPLNYPAIHFMNKVGGKWKITILFAIIDKHNRFGKLQKLIPMISKQMLSNQLRELEEDGILEREVFPELKPRVEYRLTDLGLTLLPVLEVIQEWGRNHPQPENDATTTKAPGHIPIFVPTSIDYRHDTNHHH